ncbi:CRISPR-associated DxTHG motif protein [Weissella uvarum]|nr:CRISPR-associated DxTHG motif protein [Weissella uvarum]
MTSASAGTSRNVGIKTFDCFISSLTLFFHGTSLHTSTHSFRYLTIFAKKCIN